MSNWSGRVKAAALCVLTVLATGALVFVEWLSSSAPDDTPFNGWVHVVIAGQDPADATRNRFSVVVDVDNAGDHPTLTYSVFGCGEGQSTLYLLTGGSARLSHPRNLDGTAAKVKSAESVSMTLGGSKVAEFDAVNSIRLRFDRLVPCSDPAVGDHAETVTGTGRSVIGEVDTTVFRQTGAIGIRGSRAITAMPLVGAFPVPLGDAMGVYSLPQIGLPSAVVPAHLSVQVAAGTLGLGARIESARPDTDNASELTWKTTRSVQPTSEILTRDTERRLAVAETGLTLVVGVLIGLLGGLWAAERSPAVPPSAPERSRVSISQRRRELQARHARRRTIT